MIHVFIGTKAQLIKMAPIMKELQDRNIPYNFVFSGQHQETVGQLLDNFSLKAPDVVLHEGSDITSIKQMLLWALKIIAKSLRSRKTIWQGDTQGIVLNHGDTFSTLLGAFLARLLGLKAGHVESGLRSFNLLHPFPEELTRLLVFRLSNYFFVPDQVALENVSKFKGMKVNTGANTLYDALNVYRQTVETKQIQTKFDKFALVSLHRYENVFKEETFKEIIRLLEKVAQKIPLVFILHKPTRKKLEAYDLYRRLDENPRFDLHPRYDYFDFIQLVKRSEFIITDGGSNQEECFYLGHPCLLFRKATERSEGLGENALLSELKEEKIHAFVDNYSQYKRPPLELEVSPSHKIIESLLASPYAGFSS